MMNESSHHYHILNISAHAHASASLLLPSKGGGEGGDCPNRLDACPPPPSLPPSTPRRNKGLGLRRLLLPSSSLSTMPTVPMSPVPTPKTNAWLLSGTNSSHHSSSNNNNSSHHNNSNVYNSPCKTKATLSSSSSWLLSSNHGGSHHYNNSGSNSSHHTSTTFVSSATPTSIAAATTTGTPSSTFSSRRLDRSMAASLRNSLSLEPLSSHHQASTASNMTTLPLLPSLTDTTMEPMMKEGRDPTITNTTMSTVGAKTAVTTQEPGTQDELWEAKLRLLCKHPAVFQQFQTKLLTHPKVYTHHAVQLVLIDFLNRDLRMPEVVPELLERCHEREQKAAMRMRMGSSHHQNNNNNSTLFVIGDHVLSTPKKALRDMSDHVLSSGHGLLSYLKSPPPLSPSRSSRHSSSAMSSPFQSPRSFWNRTTGGSAFPKKLGCPPLDDDDDDDSSYEDGSSFESYYETCSSDEYESSDEEDENNKKISNSRIKDNKEIDEDFSCATFHDDTSVVERFVPPQTPKRL